MTQQEAEAWLSSIATRGGEDIAAFLTEGDVEAGGKKLLAALEAIPAADRLEIYEAIVVRGVVKVVKVVRALKSVVTLMGK